MGRRRRVLFLEALQHQLVVCLVNRSSNSHSSQTRHSLAASSGHRPPPRITTTPTTMACLDQHNHSSRTPDRACLASRSNSNSSKMQARVSLDSLSSNSNNKTRAPVCSANPSSSSSSSNNRGNNRGNSNSQTWATAYSVPRCSQHLFSTTYRRKAFSNSAKGFRSCASLLHNLLLALPI